MNRFLSAALCALFVSSVCATAATAATAAPDAAKGQAVYDASCVACHKAGLMGAPKLGEKAAWAPRIAQGNKVLVNNAVNGFKGKVGAMLPKGGNAKLTNAEVENAVAYMVKQAK
ncbi:MAG: cytochrome c5 family protein [Chlorobium sp.]|nr:MAG: cytochrome c5 family protein [Chlorobium sp.]